MLGFVAGIGGRAQVEGRTRSPHGLSSSRSRRSSRRSSAAGRRSCGEVIRSCAVPPAKTTPVAAPSSLKNADIKDPRMTRGFNAPEAVPEEGIASAVALMRSGDLFRYNRSDPFSEVSIVEEELAAYTGHRYCVALNSCGSAIFLALLTAGVKRGDEVFANALTFTAVPSAVHHAGASCVMIESNASYVMDVQDFEHKVKANPQVKVLLLSHMRGKVTDMDEVARICREHDITVVEDCAHSLGVLWAGKHTGHIGLSCCVSSQSYKMLNSGEGGFLLTNDATVAAKTIGYAGGYENLFMLHSARPDASVFESLNMKELPNYSLRMHNLTAAVLRPQLKTIEARVAESNRRFIFVANMLLSLAATSGVDISIPPQDRRMRPCNDSLQFNLLNLSKQDAVRICELSKKRGVPLSLFGSSGNARNFRSWQYLYGEGKEPELAQTSEVIAFAADIRLPPQFSEDELRLLVHCLIAAFQDLRREQKLEASA